MNQIMAAVKRFNQYRTKNNTRIALAARAWVTTGVLKTFQLRREVVVSEAGCHPSKPRRSTIREHKDGLLTSHDFKREGTDIGSPGSWMHPRFYRACCNKRLWQERKIPAHTTVVVPLPFCPGRRRGRACARPLAAAHLCHWAICSFTTEAGSTLMLTVPVPSP